VARAAGALDTWKRRHDEVAGAIATRGAPGLAAAASSLAAATVDVVERLAALSWSCSPAQPALVADADAVLRATSMVLSGTHARPLRLASRPVEEGPLEAETPEQDPFCQLFGLQQDRIVDAEGYFSVELVIAEMHGRYDWLLDRLEALTRPLTTTPLDMDKAITAVRLVTGFGGPQGLFVARSVKRLILETFAADPLATALALRALRARTDRSAANNMRVRRTHRQLGQARDDAEAAMLLLEQYRQLAEGQLRPWAFTLLRLQQRRAGSVPELGRLNALLDTSGDPLARIASSAILAGARNAAAHEDFDYDRSRGLMVVGDDTISTGDLRRAMRTIATIVGGAEAGWTAARAESPALRQAMDVGDSTPPPAVLLRRKSVEHFATNGLRPVDSSRTGDQFTVVLEDLVPGRINPCMQALIWSARYQRDVAEFRVELVGRHGAVLVVDRGCLDDSFELSLTCRGWFSAMPTSLFLGVNAAARLTVESSGQGADAVAWLAANDVVHAFNEAHDLASLEVRPSIEDLWRRAYVAERGARLGLAQTGKGGAGRLHRVIRRLGDVREAISSSDPRRLDQLENESRRVHETLRPVAPLPSWSPWVPPAE
jgi:hypothetical protein